MRTTIFRILIIGSVLATSLQTQAIKTPNLKWGNPTEEELSMTDYTLDPEANALVLCEIASQRYDFVAGEFKLFYQVKCRLKILKNEGKEQANIFIPYYSNNNKPGERELIESFKGTSFNLVNGKVLKDKVTKDMISYEDINRQRRVMKVTFPKVEAGTVIEYEYTINSDFYRAVRDWDVQHTIPVVYTKYTITFPEWFRHSLNMTGRYHLDVKESSANLSFILQGNQTIECTGKVYEFEGHDLPALKKEPFLYNPKVYGQKVAFEIVGVAFPGVAYKSFAITWADVDRQLLDDEDFGGLLKKNPLKAEMQQAGIFNITDRKERIYAIINLLRSRVKWNETYSLKGSSVSKALKDGSANNTTLNFMLIAMLKDAGIEASPAVLCSRDNGPFIATRPSLDILTTTVVIIPNEEGFDCVDGAAEHSGVNVLNPLLIVNNARIVDPNIHDRWIDLTEKSIASTRSFINADIDENGMLTATRQISHQQIAADNIRKQYRNTTTQSQFPQERFKDYNIEISEYSIEGIDDISKPVKETLKFSQQQTIIGDRIYVNWLIFPLMTESPFKSESRVLPIDLPYRDNQSLTININIPQGWEFEEIPKSVTQITEDGGISLKVLTQINGNTVNVVCRISNSRILFPAEEYDGIKMFYDDMAKLCQNMIVIKKKE